MRIEIEHSQDSFGDLGKGADVAASIERFGEALQERIQAAYPDATVTVDWTARDLLSVYTGSDDPGPDEAAREAVEAMVADLFGDPDSWLVLEQ